MTAAGRCRLTARTAARILAPEKTARRGAADHLARSAPKFATARPRRHRPGNEDGGGTMLPPGAPRTAHRRTSGQPVIDQQDRPAAVIVAVPVAAESSCREL